LEEKVRFFVAVGRGGGRIDEAFRLEEVPMEGKEG